MPHSTWTSFGQLASLHYTGAPALHRLGNGIPVYEAASVTSTFQFDASGSRSRHTKERLTPTGALAIEETTYLGSYERVTHHHRADLAAPLLETKTVHRHSLGGVIYTRTEAPDAAPVVTLTTVIADHLGSTDALLTGTWDGNAFAAHTIERQSFAAFGERRDATTWDTLRTAAADPQHTSTLDIPRGFTGHEHLDDSGLIHMNGRIYDPEVGRFLSPDPVVQIPEYSQDFNRYTYCLNNPLNATDPSGFSWISKAFSKVGKWLKENWRTVVVIVVVAVVTWGVGAAFLAGGSAAYTTTVAGVTTLNAAGMAATGAIAGAVGGGLNAAIHGGNLGDVLRGAVVGAIQGAITGYMGDSASTAFNSGKYGKSAAYVAGHGIVGGASNEALGGKFQDGFLSAFASNVGHMGMPIGDGVAATIKSGIVGGTASVIGGGKFSNGAYTGSFQYLVSIGLSKIGSKRQVGNYTTEERIAIKAMQDSYLDNNGGFIREFYPKYQERWGFAANMTGNVTSGYIVAFRGTQLTSLKDWYNNVMQALGIPTPQYSMAMDMARVIYDKTGGNVTFVGHSLGGGLASAAAMVTGARAITLNAAGLHPWTAARGNPNVSALYMRGDILSLGQDYSPLARAYGQRSAFNPSRLGGPFTFHGSNNF